MLPTHVRKRDGRLVAFDLGKLKRSIRAALEAAEDPGSEYAEDAAYAIAMHLGKTFPQQPPRTSDIAVTVARALEEGYSPRASASYLDYRVARDEQRAKCTVIKPQQISLLDADTTVSVMTGSEQNARPWNRAFIVRALEQEAHVRHSAAETIAQEVENRVLSSGLSVVTTTLIRAIVDSELLAKGYTNSLRQRSSVTVPYEELRKNLNEPEELNLNLGSKISIPYSLSHIYSEDVAMAHRQGLIGIGGLNHPFSRFMERYEMDADQNVSSFRKQWISELKKLENALCDNLICSFRSDFLKKQPRERIMEIYDTASSFEGRIYLTFPAASVAEVAELIRDCEVSENVVWQFTGETADIPKTVAAIKEFSARGFDTLWQKNELTPNSQLIGINLPRIVYKYKSASIEQLLLGLQPSLEAAVHACRQYRLFAQANGQLRMSDVPACELIGLREAIASYCGQDKGEEALRVAETIMSAAREILRKLADAYYFEIHLVSGCGTSFGKRFSIIDERLFPEIFGFLPFHDPEAEALRHNIPPYRLLESAPGDTPEDVKNWVNILNANCDSGLFAVREPEKELLEELLQQSFGILVKGQSEESAPVTENRGQTSLF